MALSVTHEQALVGYDPKVARPAELLGTLRDIGYTASDPRKVRPFEEQEQDLVNEGRRFLTATGLSTISIALIVHPAGLAEWLLPTIVFSSLLAFVLLAAGSRLVNRDPGQPRPCGWLRAAPRSRHEIVAARNRRNE